jgi:thymidylate synthase (FAD)
VKNLTIDVLDTGFVKLDGMMRHFVSNEHEVQVVNAARASFEKEVTELGKPDIGLINFLIRRVENSPFRHSVLAFEVKAPLMTARQWQRYSVGSAHLVEEDAHAWSEGSRRYVTEEPTFYVPTEWRSAPENRKQGSGEPVLPGVSREYENLLRDAVRQGIEKYERALADGVCAEQARLFLPAYAMHVRWRWTASLLAVLHFLDERLAHKAQREISDYAVAVEQLARPFFPHSFGMLGDHP